MSEIDAREGKPSRDYHWYVFLFDDGRANEIVARALNVEADNAERLRHGVMCSDDIKRNLWRVEYSEIRVLVNAGIEFKFKVSVFSQEGELAPRPWVNPNILRRKKTLRKKVTRAK